MPIYKFTLFFQEVDYGWTESYYLNTPSPTLPSQLYATYGVPLFNARIAILGLNATLNFVRISTYGTPYATSTTATGLAGTYPVNAAFPNVGVLLRCNSTTVGPAKNIFLRGIPYTILVGGVYTPNAVWNTRFTAYSLFLRSSIQNGGWGWVGSQIAAALTAPLTGYTLTEGSTVAITTTSVIGQPGVFPFQALPINSKKRLRFSGVNGKSKLNGSWVFTITGNNAATSVDQFALLPYTHGGFVRVDTFAFNQFSTVNAERAVSRKAGRVAFLEVGKAKRQILT